MYGYNKDTEELWKNELRSQISHRKWNEGDLEYLMEFEPYQKREIKEKKEQIEAHRKLEEKIRELLV